MPVALQPTSLRVSIPGLLGHVHLHGMGRSMPSGNLCMACRTPNCSQWHRSVRARIPVQLQVWSTLISLTCTSIPSSGPSVTIGRLLSHSFTSSCLQLIAVITSIMLICLMEFFAGASVLDLRRGVCMQQLQLQSRRSGSLPDNSKSVVGGLP